MNILFIGDIFGKLGIESIKQHLPNIKKQYLIDLVIANAENTTNCRGLNSQDYKILKSIGVDYFTMGNHTWRQNDWIDVIQNKDIIRPFNIIDEDKNKIGSGCRVIEFKNKKIQIINLIGNSLKSNYLLFSNPFIDMQNILDKNKNQNIDIIIVDFHTETTSEKNCFLQAFKSKISVILGTHTHIQTNDAKIVDGTAYITDVGMTGPSDGIIGADAKTIIEMFQGKNEFFKLTEAKGNFQFCAVLLNIDDITNKPVLIKPLFL